LQNDEELEELGFELKFVVYERLISGKLLP